jgi:low temperature requirement protein LtrA
LIFVVSIIQLGNVLADDVSWHGAGKFAIVFILLFWAWMGTTVYLGRFGDNGTSHRILVFAQMLAVANMAVLVDGAIDGHAQGFLLSFVANQVILALMYLRRYRLEDQGRSAIARVVTIIVISAAVFLVSAFVPPPWRFFLWLLALLITFLPPVFKDYMGLGEWFEVPHEYLSERLGLFTIIVLGESFIKTVGALSGQPLPFPNAEVLGGLCFIVAASLWWTYFDDVAKARVKPGLINLQVLIYAHLPLAMGITAFGVSTKQLVLLELGETIPGPHLWFATMSVAIAMLAIAVIDAVCQTERESTRGYIRIWPRIASATMLLSIAALSGDLRAEITLSLVAAVCVAQIGVESYVVRRVMDGAAGD